MLIFGIAQIKSADMSEDMQQEAIDVGMCDLYPNSNPNHET